jgi:ATP-dependent protease HslVU (ClpYQ) peptidase subunit
VTCIATDGRTMAADSMTCSGDLVLADATRKIVRGKDGSVMGCAGEAASCSLVREWFERGESHKAVPKVPSQPDGDGDSRFKALILRPGGRLEFLDACFTPVAVKPPMAIGSGGDVAMGAMMAGASPKEAVRIAASVVVSVGGPVRTMKPKRKP